jgi:general nucleoside transport system permease protein
VSSTQIISLLAAAVTAGTAVLFAALGEIVTEKSGVLNLGVEGMMLTGAVAGFMTAYRTGSLWFGIMAAMLAAGLLAMVHAFLTVTLKANQVVSGLALTMFGTGLSAYLGKSLIGIPAKSVFRPVPISFLSDIPVLGSILFQQNWLVYISYFFAVILWFMLFKTKIGLLLRAVGENPAAADAMGINVFLIRYLAIGFGGMMAGLGGAYLSLSYAPAWLENMTAGRGWIAVAMVIFAGWNPLRALLGSYFFGGIDALGFRLQIAGISTSSFFLRMLPYLLTIAVLILTNVRNRKKSSAPAALSVPYDREER